MREAVRHLRVRRIPSDLPELRRRALDLGVPHPSKGFMKSWGVATFVTVAALGFLLVMIWLA